MITPELLDKILLEWSYRCDKGYPDVNNPADWLVLENVLVEMGIDSPNLASRNIISEAKFDPANLNKEKYFRGFIEKISSGEPFVLEKDKSKVIIDKSFLETLEMLDGIKNLSARQDKMRSMFGRNAVIPLTGDNDGEFIRLSDISKGTFTTTETEAGLQGTETADFKEGLVVFFYECNDKLLGEFENRVTNNASIRSNIESNINSISAAYYGQKASNYVTSGIELLLSDVELDPKTKKLYLNAISAARTIRSNIGPGLIIDRGDLYEKIKKVAADITKIPKDKWCPGDVYLYKKSSVSEINRIVAESKKNNSIINIEDKSGNVLQVGLNSLFESTDPLVFAISLKEEEAVSGRAKEFLVVKNISGEQLGSQRSDFTRPELLVLKGETKITKKIAGTIETSYDTEKKRYGIAVRKFGYKNTFGSSKVSKEPDPMAIVRKKLVKSAAYRLLTTYFEDFNVLKSINPIMSKYKDPFLALTAFGVSLSGFNPTFYKVVASSKGTVGHITEFKGRDSLKLVSESILTVDTVTKAGIYLEFITKMGRKKYKTKLDIREAKGSSSISIAIIVDEFKEA